jgi:hypothetical protein
MPSRLKALQWLAIAALVAGCGGAGERTARVAAGTAAPDPNALRFTGTLEAVRSRTIVAPRLAISGTFTPMTITTLAKPGTRVKAGDILLEFDSQDQIRLASDKRAELVDLDSQIQRKHADQTAEEEKDRTGTVAAQNDIERAKLAVSTNELIARVEAEKNALSLQQSLAKLEQLQVTAQLKRVAAAADLRILEIRRERSERALRYAEENATKMQVRAPFAGLVVVKMTYKPGSQGQVEIVEGDSARPGMPIIDLVDTSAMQVRARVNQADAEVVKVGMPATVRLDGFPELSFKGRIEQLTPLATVGVSSAVRLFVAVVSIDGSNPQLLPDLTASVEVAAGAVAVSTQASAAGKGKN